MYCRNTICPNFVKCTMKLDPLCQIHQKWKEKTNKKFISKGDEYKVQGKSPRNKIMGELLEKKTRQLKKPSCYKNKGK